MTENEYLQRRKEIDKQHRTSISDLEFEYCLAKTPYSVGDIVEDHVGAVKITEIMSVWHGLFNSDFTKLSLVFKGVDVKKSDFTPKKNGGERDVYESNIEKVLKKNVQE